jgi:hypothetical protein
MQLTFLLALVLAFCSLLSAEGRPVVMADEQLAYSALACASFLALAWWTGQLRRHAGRDPSGLVARCLRRGEQALGPAYLAVVALVFIRFDFAEIVHSNWRLGAILWGDDGLVVLALMAPLVGAWLLDPLSVAVGETAVAEPSRRQLAADVVRRARQTVLLPLVPVLLITGIADLERWLHPADHRESGTVLAAAALVVIACTLPWLLRICWPTCPLQPGPERSVIEATLVEAGVSVRQILRWETGGHLANAAMSGFLPRLRYLFVSDELLRRMGPEELRAMTAHEAAHCRHGHLTRLALSLVGPFVALSLADPMLASVVGTSAAWTPVTVLTILGLWAISHGRWARLLEHHADLAACQHLSGGARLLPESIAALDRALHTAGAGRGDWLHPSSAARVALLELFAEQPAAADAFERRLLTAFRRQQLLTAALLIAWLGSL